MNFADALKTQKVKMETLRGKKWMYWDVYKNAWVVRGGSGKTLEVLIETEDEAAALNCLLAEK